MFILMYNIVFYWALEVEQINEMLVIVFQVYWIINHDVLSVLGGMVAMVWLSIYDI